MDGPSESSMPLPAEECFKGRSWKLPVSASPSLSSQPLTHLQLPYFPLPSPGTTTKGLRIAAFRLWTLVLTPLSPKIAGKCVNQGGAERSRWDMLPKILSFQTFAGRSGCGKRTLILESDGFGSIPWLFHCLCALGQVNSPDSVSFSAKR